MKKKPLEVADEDLPVNSKLLTLGSKGRAAWSSLPTVIESIRQTSGDAVAEAARAAAVDGNTKQNIALLMLNVETSNNAVVTARRAQTSKATAQSIKNRKVRSEKYFPTEGELFRNEYLKRLNRFQTQKAAIIKMTQVANLARDKVRSETKCGAALLPLKDSAIKKWIQKIDKEIGKTWKKGGRRSKR